MEIDHRPAWEVLREWYPRLTDEDVADMVARARQNPMMDVAPGHVREGGFSMFDSLLKVASLVP